MDLRIEIFSR